MVKIIYFLQEQYTLKAKLKATQNSIILEIRIDKILCTFLVKIKKRLAELMMIDHSLGHDELIGEFLTLSVLRVSIN